MLNLKPVIMKGRCFWCGNNAGGNHVEHILPEALGCPDGFFISSDWICKTCNNGLAHLDQAVFDEFDLQAFLSGVPRKGGKPPVVASRGNLRASIGNDGPTISVNMESHAVEAHDGKYLAPFRGKERDVNADFKNEDDLGSLSFSVPFGARRKFVRGIFKIALSALGHFVGFGELYKEKYNPIRDFVRKGKGERQLLVLWQENATYRNNFDPPRKNKLDEYTLPFTIGGVQFLVPLDEGNNMIAQLKHTAIEYYGESGWTYLPR